jgi:gliding motility-associated lipoprotein GldH
VLHVYYFCKKNSVIKKSANNWRVKFVAGMAAVILAVASCNSIDVYEKNSSIPNYQWSYQFKPAFEFTISDTSAQYMIYVVLRHTDAYRYNNIWLNAGTRFPGDSIQYQRFEFQLGDDARGWEGTGMDDIWEVRKPITRGPVKFAKAGTYSFVLAQVMREDPLPNVLSAGIRVEKVK